MEYRKLENYSGDQIPSMLKGRAAAIANKLMNYGVRTGDVMAAIQGAELFDKLGFAYRPSVKNRLIALVEQADIDTINNYMDKIEALLRIEPRKGKKQGEHDLEEKVHGAELAIMTGMILFLSFFANKLSFTGFAVSAMPTQTASWIGMVFIALGVVALAFFRRALR